MGKRNNEKDTKITSNKIWRLNISVEINHSFEFSYRIVNL